jgi:hypothetical protein
MAHFAKLAPNFKVMSVHSLNNDVIKDSNGVEQESIAIDFLTKLHNWHIWKQTSYNNNIRKNFASIGYTYDETRDAFISPKPFNSWILNENTCRWEAPIEKPITYSQNILDNNNNLVQDIYIWNETIQNWILTTR